MELEYERNRERYQFLRWGQTAFDDFKVVPPGTGIVHQVNIEYLARTVMTREVSVDGGAPVLRAYPDSCVGTDSHTTMVNEIGRASCREGMEISARWRSMVQQEGEYRAGTE